MQDIYQGILHAKAAGKKQLAVLLDPDKITINHLEYQVELAQKAKVDYFFVGSSLLLHADLDLFLQRLRQFSNLPLVLFPGNHFQISRHADAFLFLSLISGRNPELLIGRHVLAAPYLKQTGLEVISTGYLLIDGGANTSVLYLSNTAPIPSDKNDIAVGTALAGEMLGLKLLYLEAGSGAAAPVPPSMVAAVAQAVSTPLIVGGGIRTPEQAAAQFKAGADLLVVGNILESDPGRILELAFAR